VLEQEGLAVLPWVAFGDDHCIRPLPAPPHPRHDSWIGLARLNDSDQPLSPLTPPSDALLLSASRAAGAEKRSRVVLNGPALLLLFASPAAAR